MGWKIYFWVFTVLTILGGLAVFTKPMALIDWINAPFNLILIAGLYFYAYKKKVDQSKWKIIFWVSMVYWGINAAYELILPVSIKSQLNFLESAAFKDYSMMSMLIGFLAILPALYTLYKLSNQPLKR